jgi:ankyrin repeat protein
MKTRTGLLALALAFVVTVIAATFVWYQSTRAPVTPLALAAHQGDEKAVRALIAAGADPNEIDGFGFTPLAWAARGGQPLRPHVCSPQDERHLATVRALLELGADPTIPDRQGWLPERIARHHKQDASAALLAKR